MVDTNPERFPPNHQSEIWDLFSLASISPTFTMLNTEPVHQTISLFLFFSFWKCLNASQFCILAKSYVLCSELYQVIHFTAISVCVCVCVCRQSLRRFQQSFHTDHDGCSWAFTKQSGNYNKIGAEWWSLAKWEKYINGYWENPTMSSWNGFKRAYVIYWN